MTLIISAFYIDIKSSRIPNKLTITFVWIGFAYHFAVNGWGGLLFSLSGFVIGIVLLMILYFFRALGAGDVKLFGAIGACMGMEFTLYGLMYSILFAGIIGLLILLFRQEFIQRMTNLFYYFLGIFIRRDFASFTFKSKQSALTFPFMYAVLPGIGITSYYLI